MGANNYYATASGVALVGDGTSTLSLASLPNGTTVKLPSANSSTPASGSVYIPVTNPPSTTAKLTKVSFEIETAGGAEINEVYVYFGKQLVLDAAGHYVKDDFVDATKTARVPDADPFGISVSFDVSLPNAQATLTVYSVSLTFSD